MGGRYRGARPQDAEDVRRMRRTAARCGRYHAPVTERETVIVGGGFAGVECAYQLARRGHRVRLFEMRPTRTTEAHETDRLAEMVCSNSFRSDNPLNAVGLLKREMESVGSLVLQEARKAAPTDAGPARSALPDEPTAAGHASSDARLHVRLRDVESLRTTAASTVRLPRPMPGGMVSAPVAAPSRPGLTLAAEAASMRPVPASAPVVDRSLLGTLRDAATLGFRSRDEAVRVVQAHKS